MGLCMTVAHSIKMTAEQYLQREWSQNPIFERYDWLYSYDANTVEL